MADSLQVAQRQFFSLNQTNLYANFLPYLAVLFLLSIYWIPGGDHLFDVPVTNFLCSINSSSSFQLKAWCESTQGEIDGQLTLRLNRFDLSYVWGIQWLTPLPTHPSPWSLGLPSEADPTPLAGTRLGLANLNIPSSSWPL